MGTTSSRRWQKLGRYQSNARNRPRGVGCSLMAVCASSSIAGDAEDERRRLDTCSGFHRYRLMEAYLSTPLFRFRDLLGVSIWLFLSWTLANLCGSVEGNTTGAISLNVRWWGSRGGVKRGRPISSGRFEDERNARCRWKLAVLCVLRTCTKPSMQYSACGRAAARRLTAISVSRCRTALPLVFRPHTSSTCTLPCCGTKVLHPAL